MRTGTSTSRPPSPAGTVPRQRPLPARHGRDLVPRHSQPGAHGRRPAPAADRQGADVPAPRAGAGHRPHRLGQEHHAGRHDRADQLAVQQAHHHAGRPGRVPSREQEMHDRAARTRRRLPELRLGPAARAASGPGHHPGRRNARPGDDQLRHHRRRNRPPGVQHAAHDQRAADHRAYHRHLPGRQQNQIRSMLANTLQAVICQTLFKRIDQPGMVPGTEIMLCTSAMRNCIRENRIFEIPNIIETSRRLGMQSWTTASRRCTSRDSSTGTRRSSGRATPARWRRPWSSPGN